MPKPRAIDVANVRMEIAADQMAQMRAAAGRKPLVQWAIDALQLGCVTVESGHRDLPIVYRSGKPVESLFLELPPDLAARTKRTAKSLMVTRTAFARSCFALAIQRG